MATSCLFGLLRGVSETEQESIEIVNNGKKRQAAFYQQIQSQCSDLRKDLYDKLICHRIRDVFHPIRQLVVYSIRKTLIVIVTDCL